MPLRHEPLEARLPLTADLAFSAALADQAITEGDTVDVSFQFTDSATVTAGTSVGFDPGAFASLGVFDPDPLTTSIVFDTDALTVSGFAGSGALGSQNAGNGAYDVAVFTFDSFDLDAGQTVTAIGSRPLVILSQTDLTVGGVIDVSANGRIAGVGGGDGGAVVGSGSATTTLPGDPALGAAPLQTGGGGPSKQHVNFPANFVGGGGGFGGEGGGNPGAGSLDVNGGFVHGDLMTALQGGSGGGASKWVPSVTLAYEGGGGGGGIELGAAGDVIVESTGSVLANGGDGQFVTGVAYSGAGGSGGGILIHALNVTVNGTLSAEGGDATANAASNSGGGGGGRILIARDENGIYDLTGAAISVAGGQAGIAGGAATAPADGEDGMEGAFSDLETTSSTSIDSYEYTIELLDGGGGLLETLVGPTTVTDIVVNMAGDALTGTVTVTGLDSILGYLADDADLQVRVTVSDSQSTPNVITDTFDLTVQNDAPNSVVVASTASIDENGTATLDVSFADAGVEDEHTVTVNWGDGAIDIYTLPVGDRSAQFTHDYLDDAPSGTAADNFGIVVSINDDDGGGDSGNAVTTVNNVAPTIGSVTTNSPAIGGVEAGQTVNLTADFFDVGTLDTHTAVIDWGDGTTTAATVAQLAGTLAGSHVYSQGGFYDVTVTLTDDDTGEATTATQTVIAGVGVQDGVLVGVGTNGNDWFKVFSHWCYDDLIVLYRLSGGSLQWTSVDAPVAGIDLHLGGGDDIGFVSSFVGIDAYMNGGAGDDMLIGGGGDDILLGGVGYDLLYGGHGRDLLIGGDDSDLIFGDGGSDILISGTTAYDADRASLDLIMAEWTSSRSYAERVDNITGDLDMSMDGANEEVYLISEGTDATVFDDEAIDWLIGGSGKDLYFEGDDDISFASFYEIVEEIEAEAPTS